MEAGQDAHYKYGKPTPDHPDYLTSVDYKDTKSGERPLGWKGGPEEQFAVVNAGKVGDHLVGANDRMVPEAKSEEEQDSGLYTGGVAHNMRMARQHEEDGLIGDSTTPTYQPDTLNPEQPRVCRWKATTLTPER